MARDEPGRGNRESEVNASECNAGNRESENLYKQKKTVSSSMFGGENSAVLESIRIVLWGSTDFEGQKQGRSNASREKGKDFIDNLKVKSIKG